MKKFGQVHIGRLVLAAATLALVSCGGDDDASAAKVTQSCTTKLQPSGYTLCQETTAAQEIVTQVIQSCTGNGGTAGGGGCPTSDVVGKCTVSDPRGSTTSILYKPATTTDAQTLCGQMGGTFSS